MDQYIEYVADFLLWRLGFASVYGGTNPVSIHVPATIYTFSNVNID